MGLKKVKKGKKAEVKNVEVKKDEMLRFIEAKMNIAKALIELNNSKYNITEDKDKALGELIETDSNFIMSIILNYSTQAKKVLLKKIFERMMEFGITLSVYPMITEPIILQKPIKGGGQNYIG